MTDHHHEELLGLLDICNHRDADDNDADMDPDPGDCELRAPPNAFTPLGGIIKTSGDYSISVRTADADAGCRRRSLRRRRCLAWLGRTSAGGRSPLPPT